ncbi:YgfZ/GcvT domain-containing protein [Candidatus Odyssella acanthamoebae]|uniref:CAF17-like 4Fe-4S cluster assembly/insertion protein YgfZ n=1 Tax=Candidatus Odyssella acanthamoebae TaxID=91604 RepID=UPI0005703382|nr:folate-binding protein YgfZ [Candidatus Paracaedibacter acanthamoebae]
MAISGCILTHRALIRVGGADKLAFLQGLVSNDMGKLNTESSLFTLLLSPQGRVQFDLIVHQVSDNWFLEVDADQAAALIKRLTLFKLRSDVALELVQDRSILSIWGPQVASALELAAEPGATRTTSQWTAILDPRLIELGARLVIENGALETVRHYLGLSLVDMASYKRHRYALGVPEGATELEFDRAIPLEWGMDELNAIDWAKGCYMGQELTARTRYRGLVRKRIFPVYTEAMVLSQPILCEGKDVGHWIAKEEEVGLAMIRLSGVHKELECDGQAVTLGRPHWMKLPDINDET